MCALLSVFVYSAVILVRECIEEDMLLLLKGADTRVTRAAADLNPALKSVVKLVVQECVTFVTSAERQTLEQALCKHFFSVRFVGVWFMLCQEHTMVLKQGVRTCV